MKKPWKLGLTLGAALAALALAVLVVANMQTGRTPTIPTPPGVSVPAGMRYVGGDEFNAPDGTRPPPEQWLLLARDPAWETKTHADGNSVTTEFKPGADPRFKEASIEAAAIRGNALSLRIQPSDAGDIRTMRAIRLTLGKAGKVEYRIRMQGSPMACGSVDLIRDKSSASLFLLMRKEPGDAQKLQSIFPPHIAEAPSAIDGQFHLYAMEWTDGAVRFSRDGTVYASYEADSLNSPFTYLTQAPDWVYRLPKSEFLHSTFFNKPRRIPSDAPWTMLLLMADPGRRFGVPSESPCSMEIDYIRIFQVK